MHPSGRLGSRPTLALLGSLMEREIKNRFVGAGAGGLWIFLQPLLLLAIYAFVFRTVFRVELPDLGPYPFVAFVAVALWPWMAFQEGVQRGALSIQANASLIKKVAFPHELLILAAVGAAFALHLLGFVAVLSLMSVFGPPVHWQGLLATVPAFCGLFLLALALAGVLGALQVFFRDIEHLLPPVMMVVFYGTPILYPLELVPEPIRAAMAWNPIALMIEPLRSALLRGNIGDSAMYLIALPVGVLLLLVAWRVFRRLSPHFEDFA